MKIGTRSSAMAIAQTEDIVRRLIASDRSLAPEIVRFKPSGDIDQVSRLDRHGGKGGAFVGEIRAAMMAGELDCAMHSLKDMPGDEEAPGLVIAAMLERESPADALAVRPGVTAEAIFESRGRGYKIGTNAVRRAAYLKRLLPDADIIHFRGAADTRLRKLDDGSMQRLPDGGEVGPADALVMAAAGLGRVGSADRIVRTFRPDEMLPAVGQGIVVVECPAARFGTRERLFRIDDPVSRACCEAEREMLWVLNGHCNAPIAGHAEYDGGRLRLTGAVIDLSGARVVEQTSVGIADRPRELGRKVGLALLERGAREIIETARPS